VNEHSRAVIAIDGTSGSGKSSVSRGVAARLGLDYLDTGAMYRAMAWWVLAEGIDPEDHEAVGQRSHEPRITSVTDPAAPRILVDGQDVSAAIRGPAATAAVSHVAAVHAVRTRLVDLQRQEVADSAERGRGIVVEGRDIARVVLPDADLKVYLTADPAVRAARRAAQDAGSAHGTEGQQATEESLRRRDHLDATRAVSPFRRADDAVQIDASDLTLDEVVDAVIGLLR
jgi:cytidylate kinase